MKYIETVCAICGSLGNTQEIYPENLDSVSTTPEVFQQGDYRIDVSIDG